MMKHDDIEIALFESRRLLDKLEKAAALGPDGTLSYRRYPNGVSVPYLVSESRKSRMRKRIDPSDRITIEILRNKTVARKAIPIVKRNIKALEHARQYQGVSLDSICLSLGPEFKESADFFLGRKNGTIPNPAFDCLRERQNTYPFDRNAVTTKLGKFRSKSEAYEAEVILGTGLRFKYEPAIFVGSKMVCPDFGVERPHRMDVGFIEHLGLLDHPDYREKKMQDIRDMMDHGIYPGVNLLLISESRMDGFDANMASELIKAFCLN
jgi:hypothetical protein